MKRRYWSVKSLLAAGAATLLGWLGFSSCGREGEVNEYERATAMYGAPIVSFEFKVKVVDQEDKPIAGLQVEMPRAYSEEKKITNDEGIAELAGDYTGFYGNHEVTLSLSDIDGPENGVVENQEVKAQITTDDFKDKGDNSWNNGTVKKELEFKVERK